nr:MAG TPA: hypothetical protein [Caudoviricetes sp.]
MREPIPCKEGSPTNRFVIHYGKKWSFLKKKSPPWSCYNPTA